MNTVNRTELTPLLFLQRSAAVYAEHVAAVYGSRRLTYAEVGDRVRRLATGLRRAGVRRGDRVAFLAPNVPALLEAHFGVALAGGVLVAINTRLNADEVTFILNHSGARLFFVDADIAQALRVPVEAIGGVEQIVTIDDPEYAPDVAPVYDGPEYETFIASPADPALCVDVPDENDLLAIDYTSGTTGKPKGVMYSHRSAYLNALSQIICHRIEPSSVCLWTLPMFHCNGWCFPWALTGAGSTHVLLRKIEPSLVWRLVRAEGVTHFNAAPTVLIMLINDRDAPREPLAQPLRIATGGAPPSPTLLAQWEAIGAQLTHLYGLTETYGPYTYCDWQARWDACGPADRAALRARQGVPHVVACDVRVVDEHMEDVPRDGATMGEVVMRGNAVMQGYFEQPEATAEAFRGGWFHSGDIGVMHPDGYIELRDRKKDIIISGGENISTIEVEQVLARHPDVLEVAVIAVPDEKWGEVPKAFVTLKAGRELSAAALIAHCRAHLAHFKCPKSIAFGPLPKTSTGKVQKFVLRDQEWGGRGTRIH